MDENRAGERVANQETRDFHAGDHTCAINSAYRPKIETPVDLRARKTDELLAR